MATEGDDATGSRRLRGVIFDMDGVLVRSEPILAVKSDAWNTATATCAGTPRRRRCLSCPPMVAAGASPVFLAGGQGR